MISDVVADFLAERYPHYSIFHIEGSAYIHALDGDEVVVTAAFDVDGLVLFGESASRAVVGYEDPGLIDRLIEYIEAE